MSIVVVRMYSVLSSLPGCGGGVERGLWGSPSAATQGGYVAQGGGGRPTDGGWGGSVCRARSSRRRELNGEGKVAPQTALARLSRPASRWRTDTTARAVLVRAAGGPVHDQCGVHAKRRLLGVPAQA